MNYQSLYQQFKWKQLHGRQMQENQLARIHSLCNQPKININSASILLKRTIQILQQFQDDELINLETSIPIFQAVGILQVLKSVVQAKAKLANQSQSGTVSGETRLRNQAQFLYHFWNLIDEEEIQCKELKEIIELLQSKKKSELKFILSQMYPQQEKIQRLLNCWTTLTANQQFYKHISRPLSTKNHLSNKQNTSGQQGHQLEQEVNQYYHRKLDRSGQQQLGSPICKSDNSKSAGKYLTTGTQNLQQIPNQFGYTCALNHDQEKELIDRLYKNDIYRTREQQRREKQQERQKEELNQCTFKPNLIKREKSVSRSFSQIKGYDKAINRLKAGNEKNKITKQMRDYKPIGENYQKLKQKGINPPKFLDRKKKEQQKVLFIISFDLGRHKTNVKIRQNDTEDSVAQRICKIYSLKKQFYEQIKEIVRNQLDAYYQELNQIQQGQGQNWRAGGQNQYF